ncbi:endophilin-A3b [Ictalurus furcatus]|uniref:endophilin-A3b n=1 Tax=Ictalurus furcatus TaxID=66913 RepID=UPI00234FCAA8|nr:endophilin-A3b [Ictalurus furcatus]
MSVAGLKKQFHKASQLLKEKIGGVEGTKLDEDFIRMEKKTEITNKLIVELVTKTTEYLEPNPAYRAKLSMLTKMSRIRGNVRPVGYPQTEGILGDCMLIYGNELGVESAFGSALVDMGQALKQMAEVRDCMDVRVKRTFINPLQMLQEKELKEIAFHLKKLEGRRLDFDYKKNSKRRIAEAELKQALDKFEDSKELAKRSMFNLLENDVDQVRQLLGLIEASMDYHQQSRDILENLRSSLQNKITDTSNRPKREFKSKSNASTMCCTDTYGFSTSSSYDTEVTQELSEKSNCNFKSPLDQPCCRALFNFKPENQRELGFKKGNIITLTNQVDENWYEGLLNGESGFFPVNYVEVLVPLPQ